jgi:hypothetical protein
MVAQLLGYPASHGCVRMPFDFAECLFDVTELDLWVIVAPTDVMPIGIVHPALLQSKVGASASEPKRNWSPPRLRLAPQ